MNCIKAIHTKVTNTVAKPWNWATFDSGAAGTKSGAAVKGSADSKIQGVQLNFSWPFRDWKTQM